VNTSQDISKNNYTKEKMKSIVSNTASTNEINPIEGLTSTILNRNKVSNIIVSNISYISDFNINENSINNIVLRIRKYKHNVGLDTNNMLYNNIVNIVTNAYRIADELCLESDALKWAEGFTFPSDLHTQVTEDFRISGYNIKNMAASKHFITYNDRINPIRVKNTINTSDPDYNRLLVLSEGVELITSPSFIPTKIAPKLRNKYLRLAPAINKLVMKAYNKGLVLIVPTDLLRHHTPNLHLGNATHWAKNKNKPEGRLIADTSSSQLGNALNDDKVKQLI
jgi:hypothetical protein